MKIVYLIEDFSVKGGAERIVAEKASLLAGRCGHDVTIVSIFRDYRPQSYPLGPGVSLERLDVPFPERSRGPVLKAATRLRTLALASARFNRLMHRCRPDIIFFTLGMGALLLPLCRCGAKRVYESHLARRFTPYHRLFTPAEMCADLVVCLTRGDAAEYRHARRTAVIPNFIDMPAVSVSDYSVRRAVAVGRLERAKGFDRLISCWREAAADRPGWTLDIYGEGTQREALRRQIAQLGLEGSVRLCGRVDDIIERYARYSLFIVSSRFEGQNIALLEAQASGLPVVTFNYDYGASDIVTDGRNGRIVPQDDTAAFTVALKAMMDDADLRRRCGLNGKETIISKFSKEKIFQQWVSLIGELRS